MSEDPRQDPPPQEEPTHDVPVYPEQDPPPGTQQPIKAERTREVPREEIVFDENQVAAG